MLKRNLLLISIIFVISSSAKTTKMIEYIAKKEVSTQVAKEIESMERIIEIKLKMADALRAKANDIEKKSTRSSEMENLVLEAERLELVAQKYRAAISCRLQ